jgi:hypothetical protein
MMQAGLGALALGALLALGYGGYATVRFVVLDSDAPLILRVAIPAVEVGVLLVMGAVAWDRARAGKKEKTNVRRAEP